MAREHPVLGFVDRNERRRLLKAEAAARRSGDWGPWERIEIRPNSRGWLGECRIAWRNKVFSVLVREADGATHFGITSLSCERPSWWEMQRIKNELAGPGATAVEVYPPQADVMDGADMYHLWILPGTLPFIIRNDRTTH